TSAGKRDIHIARVAVLWQVPSLFVVIRVARNRIAVAVRTIPVEHWNQARSLLSGVKPTHIRSDPAACIPGQFAESVDFRPVAGEAVWPVRKLNIRRLTTDIRSRGEEEIQPVFYDRPPQGSTELVVMVFDLAVLEIGRQALADGIRLQPQRWTGVQIGAVV